VTKLLQSLAEIADRYDAIVLDQWGVLHDGSAPYPKAIATLETLASNGTRLAVLSNSGKRSEPNAARIEAMGFPNSLFENVMTSGEALWSDLQAGHIPERSFFPIERQAGDAAAWAQDLDVVFTTIDGAEAVLLMGLPDGDDGTRYGGPLDYALSNGLPVYCSNPDLASPRGHGQIVVSPGKLAHDYLTKGGRVVFYGKPHAPIFRAVASQLGTTNLLMVGDSLDHDIAGAANAGWDNALVTGGLYAKRFQQSAPETALAALLQEKRVPAPTHMIEALQ